MINVATIDFFTPTNPSGELLLNLSLSYADGQTQSSRQKGDDDQNRRGDNSDDRGDFQWTAAPSAKSTPEHSRLVGAACAMILSANIKPFLTSGNNCARLSHSQTGKISITQIIFRVSRKNHPRYYFLTAVEGLMYDAHKGSTCVESA